MSAWLLGALVGGVGCGGDDDFETGTSDVSGRYVVSVTARENPCNFSNWMEGEVSGGVAFVVEQSDDEVSASLESVAGGLIALLVGNNEFEGTVRGTSFTATAFGSIARVESGCTYTTDAVLEATVEGDEVSGSIHYVRKLTDDPDCQALACENRQTFVGSREASP